MSIGTAKPTKEELAQAPHHFVDSLSIHDTYSVGDFELDALALLNKLFQQQDIVVMVGGSGLYIQAICEGIDKFPDVSPDIRAALTETFQKEGIEVLQEELKTCDIESYNSIDLNNPHRVMRALELYRATGKTFSSFKNQVKPKRPFKTIQIAIDWERQKLYDRINQRVDIMMKEGLLDEVKHLYPHRTLNALQTVGYKEFFDFIDNKISLEEAIELVKRNSRRYAKRQLTWFRRTPNLHLFKPNELDKVIPFLEKNVRDTII